MHVGMESSDVMSRLERMSMSELSCAWTLE
jgi:hypothetical protein